MLKEKMFDKPQKGVFVKYVDDIALVLNAKELGIDFLFYDLEHGSITLEKLRELMVFGNNIDFDSFVRVPELSKAWVSRAVDFGATGVMVPMIETKEQAIQLVEYSKYPPIGNRGYSGGANTNYGPSGSHLKHMEDANKKILTIAQIETTKGVNNAEEIVSTEGIDAVIVGPADLSISMGNVDDVYNPKEIEAITKVMECCKKYHKGFGIIGANKMLAIFSKDINLLVSAMDSSIIRNGLVQANIEYDKIIEEGKNK